jgi:hypothetical protein
MLPLRPLLRVYAPVLLMALALWAALFAVLFFPVVALAQAADPSAAPLIDNPLSSVHGLFAALRSGQWWIAGMFALFAFVGALRTVGKKVHATIPDDVEVWYLKYPEKVLWFFFDTKLGGWVLNWASAIAGCLATAYAAGAPVDGAAWKTAVLVSTSATTLIELKDDVQEWWDQSGRDKFYRLLSKPPPPAPTVKP